MASGTVSTYSEGNRTSYGRTAAPAKENSSCLRSTNIAEGARRAAPEASTKPYANSPVTQAEQCFIMLR